jgi:hypothetical protein
MRKILIVLLLIIALGTLWLWRGRDLSMFADRFHVVETSSRPIKTIVYEGNGTGGILQIDGLDLRLNELALEGAQPNIGTTKDNQLALSFEGKVLPFGPVQGDLGRLTVTSPPLDIATFATEHGSIPWPNFFEVNFMTGNSPRWKRNVYQRITWKKPNGARLEMIWRYEQFFYPGNGWTEALMTRQGAAGLIRVEISGASR